MNRRTFLTGAAAVTIWTSTARAEQSRPPSLLRVSQVSPWEGTEYLASAFAQRMRELGYVDGQNVVWSTVASVAAKKVAKSIPVVFLSVGVPVEIGLVASLRNPGGNLTGVTFEAATETYGLRFQMLREIVPGLKTLAVKAAGDPNVIHAMDALRKAGADKSVAVIEFEVRSSQELPGVFERMVQSKAEGLIGIAGAFTLLAIAIEGANYVDKILRGTKPGDLPVQQPTKLETVINLKTAKMLGLEVRQTILAQADELIE